MCAEVYNRVLGEILSALDGFKSRSQVLFLAATNRPADLDSALLRPERPVSYTHLTLPTNREV